MNQILLNGTALPLLSYTLTDSLAGLSGSASFLAPSASVLSALASPFALNLGGHALSACAESCSYTPATGQTDLSFVDPIQRTLKTARPSDADASAAAAKLLLDQDDISDLIPFPVSFAENFSCTPAGLSVDSYRGLLDAVCRDFGFVQKNTGAGVEVFADSAYFLPADAVLLQTVDGWDLEKTVYAGAVGIKTSLASRKKLRVGHYMPAGKEEEEEKAKDKQISGLDWSAAYDITGTVEWPNIPAAGLPQETPAPLATRERLLTAQNAFDLSIEYGRRTASQQYVTATIPPDAYSPILSIAATGNAEPLAFFPAIGQAVAASENSKQITFGGGSSRTIEYDLASAAVYVSCQDTLISVRSEFIQDGQSTTTDWASGAVPAPDGGVSADLVKIFSNPSFNHIYYTPISPPSVLPLPVGTFRAHTTARDTARAPAVQDFTMQITPGAFPWLFTTRTVECSDFEPYSLRDAGTNDQGDSWDTTLSGRVATKLHLGPVKFTHDFDLYDPDVPRHRYDSEVATAAESTATFDPTATISDPSSPGNLYYISATQYAYLYDTDTGDEMPVWNKSLIYENVNPQTGEASRGAAEIAGIAALNGYGLYENPSAPPQVFIPTIKYSMTKQKGVADAGPADNLAVGVQQKKSLQSFRQPVLSTGIYATASTDLRDPDVLSVQNLQTGLAGILTATREKAAAGTISGGEITEYTATAARDKQLGKIVRVGSAEGEVLSVTSTLWPADDAEIEAALQRILAKENRGRNIKKCTFLLNFDIKSGQKYENYIITTVTHDSAKGLSTATMEG